MGWHELLAEDRNKIFDFYGELFGWQKAYAETDPADLYQLFSAAGQTIGGMLTKLPSVPQPCWLYYFNVDDIGAAAKRVNAGGGRMLQGPIELPDGCWIVRCVDPQGALFALQGARGQKGAERPSDSEVGWSARWGGIASQGRMVLPSRSAKPERSLVTTFISSPHAGRPRAWKRGRYRSEQWLPCGATMSHPCWMTFPVW